MYWRPIDEAPKDGTKVLVAAEINSVPFAALASWRGAGCWVEVAGDGWIGFEPTHFCRWERPETVKEMEARVHKETADALHARRYEALKRFLIRCCYQYYVKADPVLGDQDYDHRLKLLRELEASGAVEIDPQSPTQIIWGDKEDQYPDWAKERP